MTDAICEALKNNFVFKGISQSLLQEVGVASRQGMLRIGSSRLSGAQAVGRGLHPPQKPGIQLLDPRNAENPKAKMQVNFSHVALAAWQTTADSAAAQLRLS